jgi:predicted ferric reductase
MSGTFPWYVARAGGVLAFVLLTLCVVAGLTLSGRARSTRWPRFAIEEVHRYLGILTGSFVALHGVALLLDTYLPFSLAQLVVPGASSYRPLATAFGVVAAELLAAVAASNALRKRIAYARWRRIHYATFAVWGLALVHGLTAGSDARAPWLLWIDVVCVATVAGLATWRVLDRRPVAARA